MDVEAERSCQRERSLEQPGRGAHVLSVERAPPRLEEMVPRAKRELGVWPAELVEIPGGLLEVVADDLVQLDEVAAVELEPAAKRSCSSARTALGSAS